jgi:hypothetical protein
VSAGAELVCQGEIEVRIAGEPLAAPPELQRRVDELWELEHRERPGLTDGSILSVERVDGNVVIARMCPYRLFVARERDRSLRDVLGIRAIGLSGILSLARPSRDVVVVGRRAPDVTEYPGAWELVPSGGIGPRAVGPGGAVDVLGVLLDELEEEVGVPRAAVGAVVPIGLAFDLDQEGYDICMALRAGDCEILPMPEYDEVRELALDEAAALLSDTGEHVVPTSVVILEAARRVGAL